MIDVSPGLSGNSDVASHGASETLEKRGVSPDYGAAAFGAPIQTLVFGSITAWRSVSGGDTLRVLQISSAGQHRIVRMVIGAKSEEGTGIEDPTVGGMNLFRMAAGYRAHTRSVTLSYR